MITAFFMTLWLLVASMIDIRTRRIPMWLLAVGGVCAVPALARQLGGGFGGCAGLLKGMAPGILLLGIGFMTKKVGYGDGIGVLLVGTVSGGGKTMLLFGTSMFFMAFCALVLLVLQKARSGTRIPYMPFLALAWLLLMGG